MLDNKPEIDIDNWWGVESARCINNIQSVCWFLIFVGGITESALIKDNELVWEGKLWVG